MSGIFKKGLNDDTKLNYLALYTAIVSPVEYTVEEVLTMIDEGNSYNRIKRGEDNDK